MYLDIYIYYFNYTEGNFHYVIYLESLKWILSVNKNPLNQH